MRGLSRKIMSRLSEATTENIPMYWPGEPGRSSVRAPNGLKAKVDELLSFIYESTGAEFSRNEFIIKAIRFYLSYLLKAKSKKDLVAKIETESEIS